MTTFDDDFKKQYEEELERLTELYDVTGRKEIHVAIGNAMNALNSGESIDIYLRYLEMKEVKQNDL